MFRWQEDEYLKRLDKELQANLDLWNGVFDKVLAPRKKPEQLMELLDGPQDGRMVKLMDVWRTGTPHPDGGLVTDEYRHLPGLWPPRAAYVGRKWVKDKDENEGDGPTE